MSLKIELSENQKKELLKEAQEWNSLNIKAINENNETLKKQALKLREKILKKYCLTLQELVSIFEAEK